MTGGTNRPVGDETPALEARPTAAARRDDQDLVADSKFLAYVLRHKPQAIGLDLDEAGWIPIDVLLHALAAQGRPLDTNRLDRLVTSSGKRRFQTHDGRIRAAQGHSIPVDLDLPPATPPDLLYHGTVERRLPRILAEGLQPMGRHHVHLSPDPATARSVGARSGRPVVLTIAAGAMHAAGHTFYQAANGVWLAAHVPPTYLTHIPG
jgi:putative RNA 2'-phosphotransferase